MTTEPDYSFRRYRSHACAVPWSNGGTDTHWRCPKCGRWWARTWETAGDQPPVDYDHLARHAGMPCDEIELKRQRIVYSISAAPLMREAESWNFLRTGEAEQTVTTTLADFAKALGTVPVPQGVPAAA